MGFKRDSAVALLWKQWLLRNRDELAALGIPAEVVSNQGRWQHFCGHGFDPETAWNTRLLSAEQKTRLRAFLIREVGPDAERHCLGI